MDRIFSQFLLVYADIHALFTFDKNMKFKIKNTYTVLLFTFRIQTRPDDILYLWLIYRR